jgi:hypothetical protein
MKVKVMTGGAEALPRTGDGMGTVPAPALRGWDAYQGWRPRNDQYEKIFQLEENVLEHPNIHVVQIAVLKLHHGRFAQSTSAPYMSIHRFLLLQPELRL